MAGSGVSSVLFALAVTLLAGLPPAGAGEEAGFLDPSFGENGTVVVPPPPGAGEVASAVAVLADGGLVVAGTALPAVGGPVALLLRLRPDGRLDPSFGSGGRVWTDEAAALIPGGAGQAPRDVAAGGTALYALAVQSGGRMVVGGAVDRGATTAFTLLRYLSDGRLDGDFGSGGQIVTDVGLATDDVVSALALQPDGKILAAGSSGGFLALARYLPDGALDRAFGKEGIVSVGDGLISAGAVTVQPDGRIVVAGQGGAGGGPYDFAVARFLPDGRLDASLAGTGIVLADVGSSGESAAGVAVQPDGRIVAAGHSGASFALVRLLADGHLDDGFGTAGLVTAGPSLGSGQALLTQPDGRLVVAGGQVTSSGQEVAVARYLPDGSLDATFGTGGVVATDVVAGQPEEAWAAARQADRKLVVAGGSVTEDSVPASVILVRYAAKAQ